MPRAGLLFGRAEQCVSPSFVKVLSVIGRLSCPLDVGKCYLLHLQRLDAVLVVADAQS